MNLLVKLKSLDDGELIPKEDQVWCLITPYADGPQTFCGGDYFGEGEGGAIGVTKRVKRGGITCPICIDRIREIKAVRF